MRFFSFIKNEERKLRSLTLRDKTLCHRHLVFFIFQNHKYERRDFMTDLEKLRQELEAAKKEKLQYEHQLTRAENRLANCKKKQDKARTHRLIVEGAELEYVFDGIETIPQETFRAFLGELGSLPDAQALYKKYSSVLSPSTEGGDE